MIVITGATGALNALTVEHLLERVPASDIAVAVRSPDKAQRFAERGVDVRRADYADPASMLTAFDGADQLLLVSSNDPAADAVALHRAGLKLPSPQGWGAFCTPVIKARRSTRHFARAVTMPRPSRSFPNRACRGPRFATASMRTALTG